MEGGCITARGQLAVNAGCVVFVVALLAGPAAGLVDAGGLTEFWRAEGAVKYGNLRYIKF